MPVVRLGMETALQVAYPSPTLHSGPREGPLTFRQSITLQARAVEWSPRALSTGRQHRGGQESDSDHHERTRYRESGVIPGQDREAAAYQSSESGSRRQAPRRDGRTSRCPMWGISAGSVCRVDRLVLHQEQRPDPPVGELRTALEHRPDETESWSPSETYSHRTC